MGIPPTKSQPRHFAGFHDGARLSGGPAVTSRGRRGTSRTVVITKRAWSFAHNLLPSVHAVRNSPVTRLISIKNEVYENEKRVPAGCASGCVHYQRLQSHLACRPVAASSFA